MTFWLVQVIARSGTELKIHWFEKQPDNSYQLNTTEQDKVTISSVLYSNIKLLKGHLASEVEERIRKKL